MLSYLTWFSDPRGSRSNEGVSFVVADFTGDGHRVFVAALLVVSRVVRGSCDGGDRLRA